MAVSSISALAFLGVIFLIKEFQFASKKSAFKYMEFEVKNKPNEDKLELYENLGDQTHSQIVVQQQSKEKGVEREIEDKDVSSDFQSPESLKSKSPGKLEVSVYGNGEIFAESIRNEYSTNRSMISSKLETPIATMELSKSFTFKEDLEKSSSPLKDKKTPQISETKEELDEVDLESSNSKQKPLKKSRFSNLDEAYNESKKPEKAKAKAEKETDISELGEAEHDSEKSELEKVSLNISKLESENRSYLGASVAEGSILQKAKDDISPSCSSDIQMTHPHSSNPNTPPPNSKDLTHSNLSDFKTRLEILTSTEQLKRSIPASANAAHLDINIDINLMNQTSDSPPFSSSRNIVKITALIYISWIILGLISDVYPLWLYLPRDKGGFKMAFYQIGLTYLFGGGTIFLLEFLLSKYLQQITVGGIERTIYKTSFFMKINTFVSVFFFFLLPFISQLSAFLRNILIVVGIILHQILSFTFTTFAFILLTAIIKINPKRKFNTASIKVSFLHWN